MKIIVRFKWLFTTFISIYYQPQKPIYQAYILDKNTLINKTINSEKINNTFLII